MEQFPIVVPRLSIDNQRLAGCYLRSFFLVGGGLHSGMAKGDDIRDRLVRFSVDIIDLCERMPKTMAGRHIANQLLRCGTAAAPNYAEARGAESARDFVHKIGIVLKELNEAEVWIDTIEKRQMVRTADIGRVQDDCRALCRIIAASVKTASANLRREG